MSSRSSKKIASCLQNGIFVTLQILLSQNNDDLPLLMVPLYSSSVRCHTSAWASEFCLWSTSFTFIKWNVSRTAVSSLFFTWLLFSVNTHQVLNYPCQKPGGRTWPLPVQPSPRSVHSHFQMSQTDFHNLPCELLSLWPGSPRPGLSTAIWFSRPEIVFKCANWSFCPPA